MQNIELKNKEINDRQRETNAMGAEDKLYQDSSYEYDQVKSPICESVNQEVARSKIEKVIPSSRDVEVIACVRSYYIASRNILGATISDI